jgi:hypothetical protein
MKQIGSIHVDDAPIGMLIKNPKNNKYYIADLNRDGVKVWKLCKCQLCNVSQSGGSGTTSLAPSPEEHSWHHHHAPFYQVFNNYVCVKRDTLGEIRDFFTEMFSSKNYLERKVPFS